MAPGTVPARVVLRPTGTAVVVLLAALLAALLVVVLGLVAAAAPGLVGTPRDDGPGIPPGAPDAAAAPLRTPPAVSDPGGYTFLATAPGGGPVRWDPCRGVHVVVRPAGEPPGGRAAVSSALEEVGGAAGLVLVLDGETDEPPSPVRPPTDRARYGERWSPVLVAWSDATEHPPLEGAVGVAGPQAGAGASAGTWVTGTVTLDAAWFGENLTHELGARQARAVLVHELAHLVGLGHSADPFSLMSPTYQQVYSLGLSDRAGLARLGGGGCTG